MLKIKMDFIKINDLTNKKRRIKSQVDDCQTSITATISKLDWQVASKASIDTRLKKVQKRLQKQSELMDGYINALTVVSDDLAAKDRNVRNLAKELVYMLSQMSFTAVGVISNTKVDWEKDEKLNRIAIVNAIFNDKTIATSNSAIIASLIAFLDIMSGAIGRLVEYIQSVLREPIFVVDNSEKYAKKQSKSGPCCAFAYAMGLNIVRGTNYDGMQFYYGKPGENEMAHYDKGGIGAYEKSPSFGRIGSVIMDNKKPVMIHYTYTKSNGSEGQHWVLGVGIRAGANTKNLSAADIIVLDPATGNQCLLSEATGQKNSNLTYAGIKAFK